jgi:hypothetical protein
MAERTIHSYDLTDLGIIPDRSIILDVTALRLSAVDHPHRQLDAFYKQLDQIPSEVCGMIRPQLSLDDHARILVNVLTRNGFRCGEEPYVRSSDTLRALETRRGTPMMLAILYVGAARRSGLEAAIMDVVSGVVIRVGSDSRNLCVGVGGSGGFAVLDTKSDRTAHVISPYPPLSNRMTLVMLLDEEAMSAERHGDLVRASTLYHRMCVIAPRHPELWWKKAAVEVRMRRYHAARMSFSSILELTRNERIRNGALDALSSIPSGE